MTATAAHQYLTRPELRRFWQAARASYERTGGRIGANGKLSGTFSVASLTEREAFEISGLVGHRRRKPVHAGDTFRISLAVLAEVLDTETEFPPLPEILELFGGPLDLAPQRREAEAAAENAFWERALTHRAATNPEVADWLRDLRWSALGSWARRHDGASLALALDAAALADEVAPIELATLATSVGPDPHCLDHGRTAGTLLVSLLAFRDAVPFPSGAVERRALLMRREVMPDLLSSDVLCVGLRAAGDGPVARVLGIMDGRHVRLTYAHLSSERLRFPRSLVVHTCENPVLVARAEQLPSPPPLICTGGQRTTAVALLLDMLADAGAEIRHHGDFDAGGLAISALLARKHGAQPWRYDAGEYTRTAERFPDRAPTLSEQRLAGLNCEPFGRLAAVMRERLVAVYEEDVLDELLEDLASHAS